MTDLVTRLRMAAVEIDRINGPLLGPAADEIERLTRQVDLFKNTLEATEQTVKMQAEEIERLRAENKVWTDRFAKHDDRVSVAVEAERERCAKLAETTEREGFGGGAYNEAGRDIAAAIRGQTDD